jgi:hypothetical protein
MSSHRIVLFAIACTAACGPGQPTGLQTTDARVDGNNGGGSDAPDDLPPGSAFVYAHTESALYRVDPDTLAITKVGNFTWSHGSDQMTDIAIDNKGAIIGISFDAVYTIDPSTAAANQLNAGLNGRFNGLSYVPADMVGTTGDDVLVATRGDDGIVFRVDPMTGVTMPIGNMGTGFASSGDLVSVTDFGTAQTTPGFGNDRLVRLAASTFKATAVGQSIGFSQIWGLAFWKDKLFGFTNDGKFVLIDPMTGAGTLVHDNGPAWWGAGVTTSAPVVVF